MSKAANKMAISLLAACFWLGCLSPSVYADVPYKTFTEDHHREFVRTQDAYTPVGSIEQIGNTAFSSPSDLYVDESDRLYIADTGNKRIVVLQPGGSLLRIIGQDQLSEPTGVFVDKNGSIYVADSGSKLVYQYDEQGKLLKKFGRPDSPLFGKNAPFKPVKVTVDKRGNLYIVSEGTTNGVVQLSPYGDFLGYFGSNDSEANLKIMLQHMFFTKEQRAKLFKNTPPSPTNLSIDKKGLIYTVTQGAEGRSIKKFNISGYNLLPENMMFDPIYSDLFIAASGNIYAVSQMGIVFEFDTEGHLLFSFGAPDDGKSRIGLFLNAAGIAVDSNEQVYVVDKERNNIQIFAPTEFTLQVHHALELYKEGFYVKSQGPWNEVLKRNSLFDLAHKGLADAYYKQQLYEQAEEEYVIAGDKEGYSNSFWEIRNLWLQNHLLDVFSIIVIVYVLWRLLKLLHRKTGAFRAIIRWKSFITNISIMKQLTFLFCFIKRPIEGFYGIKDENKVSALAAVILYLLFFAEYLFSLFYTGFIFNNLDFSDLQLSREVAIVFVPIALWIVSNYLVSTISDGEGKFLHVFKATIYSLMPYLIFKPIIVIASNALTINDAFLFSFANTIIMAWCAVLLFMMVKEIHDYTVGGTIINILITIFGMIIMGLVLFIIYVLLDQVYDFVYSVIKEAAVRAEYK
ncbi:YIP1 family protein [Paenibacillus solisilvae]|uniref:YIP1 family protein n=1 Tax=Paenibacillus solisilvae TaxID=2486751 RepID=A0ABW0VVI8_9BACL